MDRVAQGGTITLTAQYQTGVGDLVDPVGPTVDIIDADANQLVTDAVPTRISLGNFSYAYVVPALGPVGVWRAHWGGTVDGAAAGGDDWFQVLTPGEIAFESAYVSLEELRALPNLADTTKFPDAALAAAASWFETRFEEYTGVAWAPRTVTDERHYGTGGILILDHLQPRTVSAIRAYSDATTTTAYTAAELADLHLEPSGVIRRNTLGWFTSGYGLIAVDYTHGYDSPPADVVEAAKTAIRAHLLDDYQANRQYAVSTEAGIIRTSQPGPDRPFGLPEVDIVANRRNHRCPSIA